MKLKYLIIGLIVFIILAVFIIFFIASPRQVPAAISTPVSMSPVGPILTWESQGEPKLNQTFKVTFAITDNGIESPVYDISTQNNNLEIILPEGIELVSGDLNMHIDYLGFKEKKEFPPIELKVIKNGYYNIKSHLDFTEIWIVKSGEVPYPGSYQSVDNNISGTVDWIGINVGTKDNYSVIDYNPPVNEWVVNSPTGFLISHEERLPTDSPRYISQDFNFYFSELPEYNKEVELVFEIIPEKDYPDSRINLLLGQKGIDIVDIISVTKPTIPDEFTSGDSDIFNNERQYRWRGDLNKGEPFQIRFLVKTKYYGSGHIYFTVNNKRVDAFVSVSRFSTDVNYSTHIAE